MGITTIEELLPPESSAFYLQDFLSEYAPVVEASFLPKELQRIVVAPLDSCKVLVHESCLHRNDEDSFRSTKRQKRRSQHHCRESIRTLVDDALYFLLQRRERLKRRTNNGKKASDDGRNALIRGFVVAREGDGDPPRGMRAGITYKNPNEIVTLWKSSPLLKELHHRVGDEVLRMMLLHTRCFLPILHEVGRKREFATAFGDEAANYILLCGPPLCNHRNARGVPRKRAREGKKPKKKQRRSYPRNPPQGLRANASISRYSLMYCDSYSPHVALPKSHPFPQRLLRLGSNGQRSETNTFDFMLNVLFELHLENKNKQRRIKRRLGRDGRILCEELWKIHSCKNGQNFGRILDRYCPLPSFGITSETNKLQELAMAFTPKPRILSYLKSVLRRAFPKDFWGSEKNFQSLVSTVEFFVHLRRNERLTNKRLMHGFSVTDMGWLFPTKECSVGPKRRKCHRGRVSAQRTSHETAHELTLKALRWVFRGFIIPLLRTSFYVTETEFSAKELQYYRKPVWSLVRALSLQKLTASNERSPSHFQYLSLSRARERLLQQTMGLSKLRFLPKSTGMRPIAQLSKSVRFSFPCTKTKAIPPNMLADKSSPFTSSSPKQISRLPTNVILERVLDVLGFECGRREKPYGNGIDNLGIFYKRYRQYIADVRAGEKQKSDHLYFAKVDIEKCYDRIHQGYLLRLVEDLVQHNTYVVQSVKLDSAVHESDDHKKHQVRFRKLVDTIETQRSLHDADHPLICRNHNTIFDMLQCKVAHRTTVTDLLKEHLLMHTVVTSARHEPKILLQTSGISQGSTLSMLLCNLYYGNVEEFLLEDTNEQSLVSRFVDDFLFIGTNRDSLQKFLDRTHLGKEELGARINPIKTLANVESSVEVPKMNGDTEHVLVASTNRRDRFGRILFPWCGLLFNTHTGEVGVDYLRFHGGKVRQGNTIEYDGNEGQKLAYRLQTFVAPRCLPILYDCGINSYETVCANFYQMMLFAACKTVEYLREGAPFIVVNEPNIGHLLECIRSLPNLALRTIRCKSKIALSDRRTIEQAFHIIDSKLASALCWNAFCDAFSYVSSEFEIITCHLRRESKASFDCFSTPEKHDLQRNISRAWEDFQIRHLICRKP